MESKMKTLLVCFLFFNLSSLVFGKDSKMTMNEELNEIKENFKRPKKIPYPEENPYCVTF